MTAWAHVLKSSTLGLFTLHGEEKLDAAYVVDRGRASSGSASLLPVDHVKMFSIVTSAELVSVSPMLM